MFAQGAKHDSIITKLHENEKRVNGIVAALNMLPPQYHEMLKNSQSQGNLIEQYQLSVYLDY